MRELKFRVWDKKRKRMFVATTINASGCASVFIDGELYLLPAEQIELMQYTGLKDKNDKEVCDGDIVKCYSPADEPCLAVVTYGLMPDVGDHECCPCKIGFYLDEKVYFDEDFGEDDDYGDLEVIGNIHENADLLEEEE